MRSGGTNVSEKIAIKPELVIPELVAADSQDAIRQLGETLVSAGYAKDSYVDVVLEREKNYPTGIEFPLCGVAMPHGEPDEVLGAAIAIGRCVSPVPFKRMEDFSQEVDVRLVAMLAVADPSEHLDVLGKLIAAFSDEETCAALLSSDDPVTIAKVVDDAINGGVTMNHMEQVLSEKKAAGRKVFVGYFSLGDPAMGDQVERAGEFIADGVDVLELGIPYENPALDGAVVSASMARALEVTTPAAAMDSIAELRTAYPDACLQIMCYYETIEAMGIEAFCEHAAAIGADGVLAPNVPDEVKPALAEALDRAGLLQPLFVPVDLADADVAALAAAGRGYMFLQAQEGKTGARDGVSPRVEGNVRRLREAGATAALCAGFGISKPQQVKDLMAMGADGVIVGSSIIDAVIAGNSREYISSLRAALD